MNKLSTCAISGTAAVLACFMAFFSAHAAPASVFRYDPARAHIAPCAHAGHAIPLPAAFPAQFPLPIGSLLNKTKPLLKHQIGVYGFVPSTNFGSTVNFFKREVKLAGFRLLGFEVDSPNDSEGTYQGHGKIGRWQLRSLPACHRAMAFSASAVPST